MDARPQKQSRRRTIALSFLSGISLDGETCSHEKLHVEETKPPEETLFFTFTEEDKQHHAANRKEQCGSNESLMDPILEEVAYAKFSETESGRHGSFTVFRDRANTTNSDYGGSKFWKYLTQQPSLAEDSAIAHYFSSSESISSGRNRLESDSRGTKVREIRVVQPSSLQHCKNERMMLLTPKTKTPFYVFSFIPYKKIPKSRLEAKKELPGRRRNLSGSRPFSSLIDTLDPFFFLIPEKHQDEQMISYSQLLIPTRNAWRHRCYCVKEVMAEDEQRLRCLSVSADFTTSPKFPSLLSSSPTISELKCTELDDAKNIEMYTHYSPFLLDDPEFITGRHRTVVNFSTYRTSVVDYVRPSELKKSVNEKFREKFPNIQLTLTKLRSLKRDMRKIAKAEGNIDLLTVAQAYVYFEKLILKNIINKANRKLCAAVCLILSAKMNDTKGSTLKSLFERLESTFRLSRKDIVSSEFQVLIILEFALHLPTWEVLPHFQRLQYGT